MTFALHRAERADVLADVLAGLLADPLADPFAAEVVAVHSRGVERWLAHRLAARLGSRPGSDDGVCANVEFPFPGRLVGDALAAATGIDATDDPWRPERLAWPLLDVVEGAVGEPWMEVLRAHLGDEADATERDRRFAVVRHIADLFDRYATHRPAMLLDWAEGIDQDGDGAALPTDMTWQAELWRRVRTMVALPSPAERLAQGCAVLRSEPERSLLPARFGLFGLTRLPASYVDVLRALAVHRDVHLLALHASPAAWEHAIAGEPAGHPLVRGWGRDSQEMHQVLRARLAGDDDVVEVHHPLRAAAGPLSLLAAVQQGVRDDALPAAGERITMREDDRSVQVHACHGRARQAEVVRDAVCHLMADDPTLEPRDIVILCPDIDEFAPMLHAAFDTGRLPSESEHAVVDGLPAIPYRLADRSLRQTNPVLGAMAELLALVDARLTASQVLGFASLEPVRRRFGFDDNAVERLAEWVAATGARWGLDRAHRDRYSLGAVDAGTWQAAMDRLLLGIAMSEDGLRLVGDTLPLDDVDSNDIELAGRFAELVERLGVVVRDLVAARPIDEWVAAVHRAADLLFATRLADAWQRGQLDRLLDDVREESAGRREARLRLAEVRDLLADRLKGQPSRAAFRTGDLTMCTLVPMRSVPHRVVCIVGLDDGAFPRGGAPDGDNLLEKARHVGDHDRRAEDRQLLLDAVLAAEEAIVLTYDGRDVRTNELLPPSVPVNELLDVIDATARAADGGPARTQVVRRHPLQPSDPRCFEEDGIERGRSWSFDEDQLAGALAWRAPRRGERPFLPGPLPPLEEPVIGLEDLILFVQQPAKAFLRARLGLFLGSPDDGPDDTLAIEMNDLQQWGVGERMVRALLAGDDIGRVARAEERRGLLPPGAIGAGVLQHVGGRAARIAAKAQEFGLERPTSIEVDVALARGQRLVGTVSDVVGDTIRTTTYSSVSAKRRMAAWIRLLAANATHDEPYQSRTVGRMRDDAFVFAIPAVPRAEALEHLQRLVDLRARGLCFPIPLYCDTSHRYVEASRSGGEPFPEEAADKAWTSSYDWPREDRDAEHVLLHGGVRTFQQVIAEEPTADEDGPGWDRREYSRFGRIARHVWDPLYDAVAAGRKAAK